MSSTSSTTRTRLASLRSTIKGLALILGAIVLPLSGSSVIYYELLFGHDLEGLLIGFAMVAIAVIGFFAQGALSLLGRT